MSRRAVLALVLAVIAAAPAAAHGKTYLGCGERSAWAPEVQPRACFLGWPDLSLAESMGLRRIRWASWGGRTAPADAAWRYRTSEPWQHVKVWAYARRACGDGRRVYTRVRVRGANFDRVWRTPTCSDLPD